MNKLHSYLLKSFIGPFFVTCLISLFVLLMQFTWVYIDDFVGKGIDNIYIVQLLFWMAFSLVKMALALSILLSNIMTIGKFGENNELIGIKSSGISLQKFLKPLTIFIIVICIGLFFFENWIVPKANLKAFSLLYDIRKSKPAFNLKPNQFFNEFQGYSIKINKKGKNNELYGIMIYDHTEMKGCNKVILAKTGQLVSNEKDKLIIFELKDGIRYEDKIDVWTKKIETYKTKFKFWKLSFDQSQFDLQRMEEQAFSENTLMKNMSQISQDIKVVQTDKNNNINDFNSEIKRILFNKVVYNILPSPTISAEVSPGVPNELEVGNMNLKTKLSHRDSLIQSLKDSINKAALNTPSVPKLKNNYKGKYKLMHQLSKSEADAVLDRISGLLDQIESSRSMTLTNNEFNNIKLIESQIEWHRKLAIPFATFILYIIGASLGSIIRKGGIGLPMLFAVSFFIVYWVVLIFGEKLAKQGTIPAELAMWLAPLIFTPIAYILFIKAKYDSPLLKKDNYIIWFKKLKQMIVKHKIKNAQ